MGLRIIHRADVQRSVDLDSVNQAKLVESKSQFGEDKDNDEKQNP
jgi:hypothetical protein